MEIRKAESIDEVADLREEYLDSLCVPQELYSEMMMRKAETYLISEEGVTIGYALVGRTDTLLEFHVTPEKLPSAPFAFRSLIDRLNLKKAVSQSFDHLHFSMCLLHMKKMRMIGYQFRDLVKPNEPIPDLDLKVRTATLADHDLMLNNREEIFDDNEVKDIPFYLEAGTVRIFEEKDGTFVGYGMFNRTISNRDWFDIGMFVHKDNRKKGIGTYIVDSMVQHVIFNGWIPTAGCALHNTASKRTLEKAGFRSKYVMVEFEF